MTLPTLEKTWLFSTNNLCESGPSGGGNISYQHTLFTLKQTLTSFASYPWVVKGSSNSVAGGMDNVDRWLTYSNVIWGQNSARSWIVLEQPQLPMQLLFDCNHSGQGDPAWRMGGVYISLSSGFTGGAYNSRPTASDEYGLRPTASQWHTDTQSVFPSILHAMHANDGTATRVILCTKGSSTTFIQFEKPLDTTSAWATPVFVNWSTQGLGGSTASIITYAYFNDDTSGSTWVKTYSVVGSSANTVHAFTTEGFGSSMIGQQFTTAPNDIDGSWPITPMGLVSLDPKLGRIGRFADLYWGPAVNYILEGATYPNTGTREFVQFGNFIFPWDGSIPLTA